MNIEFLIITYSLYIDLFLRIVTDIVIVLFFLPLQIRQAGVKNGLKKLRIQLLLEGLILFLVNTISIFIIFDLAIRNVEQQLLNGSLQIMNGVSFLTMSVIALTIYTQNYTAKNKKHHERIDRLEKLEEQKKAQS